MGLASSPMKVDGGLVSSLADIPRVAKELEDVGYDGALHRRDGARPVLPASPGGRAHRAPRAGYGDRGGVRPQPDDHGERRLRPAGVLEGPLHPRVSAARSRRTSRSGSRCRGRSPAARMREFILAMRAIWACWNDGREARLPGRVLPPHAHDPVLQPGSEPVRQPEGVPRRRRGADDRGRGRGGRRHLAARLHDGAVRARGHDPRARARVGEGGEVAVAVRGHRTDVRGHGRDRGSARRRRARARSSRSRSTDRHPRTAGCSSCTAGATCRPS